MAGKVKRYKEEAGGKLTQVSTQGGKALESPDVISGGKRTPESVAARSATSSGQNPNAQQGMPGVMNASITKASDRKGPAPVVLTSDKAKADLAKKREQLGILDNDVQNQKMGVKSPIDQNYFMQTNETPEAYNARIEQYRKDNPQAADLNSEIDSLLDDESGKQPELSPEEREMQDLKDQESDLLAEQDQEYEDTLKTLDQIRKGTYPLSKSEHALLDSTEQMYQSLIQAQQTANTAYEGSLTEMNASLGISQSAPSQALGVVKLAIDSGNQKVASIDAQMASSLAQMEIDFRDKAYDRIIDRWNEVSDHLDSRLTTIHDMQKATQDAITKLGTSQRDTAIASLIDSGMTDASTVFKALTNLGYETSLDEVGKAMKSVSDAKISPNIITSTDGRGNTYGINKDTGEVMWTAAGTSKATGGGGSYTFTDTQLNKGAANAGMSVQEFTGMSEEAQNTFINGDIKGTKKTIDDAFEEGATLEEVETSIRDMGLPSEVEDYLIRYAGGEEDDSAPLTVDEIESTLTDTLKDLQSSGYSRNEAYKTVFEELKDDSGNIPTAQKNALRKAQDSVFGKYIEQNVNVWSGGGKVPAKN